MKKRKRMISIIMACFAVCTIIGINVAAQTESSSKDWGKHLSDQFYSKMDSTIYAIGENVSITNQEIESAKFFYVLNGMSDEEAKAAATKYVMENEAMYQAAVSRGYAVTDQEVWDFLAELKQLIEHSDNYDEIAQMIKQFKTEKDFWNFEFTVYQHDLVIQKYVHDLEQKFMEKNQSTGYNAYNAAWLKYFDQLKSDLVQKENYQIVAQNPLSE